MPNKRTKTVLPVINAGTSSHGSRKAASKNSEPPYKENIRERNLDQWKIDGKVPATHYTDPRIAKVLASQGFLSKLGLGTHFAGPTAGRVIPDGEVWRFEAGTTDKASSQSTTTHLKSTCDRALGMPRLD